MGVDQSNNQSVIANENNSHSTGDMMVNSAVK